MFTFLTLMAKISTILDYSKTAMFILARLDEVKTRNELLHAKYLRPCCMKQIDGNVLKNIPIESLQVGDLVEVNFQIVTYKVQ